MRYLEAPYGPLSLPYQAYAPAREGDGTRSLMVYLHGKGDRGLAPADLNRGWGLPRELARGLDLPFPVVSPICPEGAVWEPGMVLGFLAGLRAAGGPGPVRILLCGYSMGGTGAYAFQSTHPGHIHGVAVVAGRIPTFDPACFAGLPLLGIYGSEDPRFREGAIAERYRALNAAGGRAELEVLDGMGHYITDEAFNSETFHRWCREI